jgi:hypothetical protein
MRMEFVVRFFPSFYKTHTFDFSYESKHRFFRRHLHPGTIPPTTVCIVGLFLSLSTICCNIHTISDPNERAHFWIPDSPVTTATELLETPLADRMYIDQGEVTRMRVEADDFCDDEPGPPKVTEGAAGSSVQVNREHQRRAPYIVCVSLFDVLREWSGLNLDFTTRSVRLQSRDLVLWHGGLVLNRLTRMIRWMLKTLEPEI